MLAYTQNQISAVNRSLAAWNLSTQAAGRVESPSKSLRLGGFSIFCCPKTKDNYPNIKGSRSLTVSDAGAGMDRGFCKDGCWLLPEPPNVRSQAQPPRSWYDRKHPASISLNAAMQGNREKTEKGLLPWFD
jgi:hypothetical protein